MHSCVVNLARRIEFGWAALARIPDPRGRDVHVGKLLDDPGPCETFQQVGEVVSRR
jgi:hypothetical protein